MATRKGDSGWRIVIALQFAWAVIMIAGMLYLPETPRYLTVKGKTDEAKLSLQRLTGLSGPELDLEYESLRAGLEAEASLGASSYKDLFTRGPEKMLLRTLTGTIIQGMQQLTGINFVKHMKCLPPGSQAKRQLFIRSSTMGPPSSNALEYLTRSSSRLSQASLTNGSTASSSS